MPPKPPFKAAFLLELAMLGFREFLKDAWWLWGAFGLFILKQWVL